MPNKERHVPTASELSTLAVVSPSELFLIRRRLHSRRLRELLDAILLTPPLDTSSDAAQKREQARRDEAP